MILEVMQWRVDYGVTDIVASEFDSIARRCPFYILGRYIRTGWISIVRNMDDADYTFLSYSVQFSSDNSPYSSTTF